MGPLHQLMVTRYKRVLTAMGLVLALVVLNSVSANAAPLSQNRAGDVEAVNLGVDGRYDSPEGLDNPRPTLSWQMAETERAGSHPCHRPGATAACPADRQTAYEIQAAESVRDLKAGELVWETGRVNGSQQRVPFGKELGSRDTVAWRVRVWDADRRSSPWSEPATWSMGLLKQSDWGSARWIDYPDRAENQPMPIFARQFDVPHGKKVVDARLHLSGVGLHHATVNGKELTDEVLAPSKNHMILAQIEEWFQSHLAGIRPAAGSVAYGKLLFQPKPVGDLRYVQGGYRTPQCIARSSWTRSNDRFQLEITVPPNTTAEVRIPTNGNPVQKPSRANFVRVEGNHAIYTVPSGEFTFTTTKS